MNYNDRVRKCLESFDFVCGDLFEPMAIWAKIVNKDHRRVCIERFTEYGNKQLKTIYMERGSFNKYYVDTEMYLSKERELTGNV